MQAWTLQASLRDSHGKGEAGRMRQAGKVPAVLYGREAGNISLSLDARQVEEMVRSQGETGLVKLRLGEGKELKEFIALLREVQHDPLRRSVEHLDFYQVSARDRLQAMVPVHLVGEPAGMAREGVLQHGLREVEVECLPADLPEALEVDLSGLEIGDKLTVGGLKIPPGVRLLSDPQGVLVTLLAPRREEEKPAPPGETPAAPTGTQGQEGV